MKITINYQERYSRVELLLRSFFGIVYFIIPHLFLLYFTVISSLLLSFLAWWTVLISEKYPKSFFEFQVKMLKWSLRFKLRLLNLADGYPAIGLNGEDTNSNIEFDCPEKLNRGILLLRLVFGLFYILIPHGLFLFIRGIACCIITFIAWWAVIFTEKYPLILFNFVAETYRWNMRVKLYFFFMTDSYPPFHGREIE